MPLPALLKTSESGSFETLGEIEAGGRQIARALDQRLELGLAFV